MGLLRDPDLLYHSSLRLTLHNQNLSLTQFVDDFFRGCPLPWHCAHLPYGPILPCNLDRFSGSGAYCVVGSEAIEKGRSKMWFLKKFCKDLVRNVSFGFSRHTDCARTRFRRQVITSLRQYLSALARIVVHSFSREIPY